MTQTLMPLESTGAIRTGPHGGGLPQKYVLSDAGRRLLLARYDGRTATTDEIMAFFPGVPRYKVRAWASQLGLARRKEPHWTAADIAYLERHLHKKSLSEIGKHLGRTRTAVQVKAKRLGINKHQEGYTMRGLCLGLGCDHKQAERWIERGWLHGRRRHTERSAIQGDVWLFTDSDIRRFVKAHPQEIDPRRCDFLWLLDVLIGLGDLGGSEASA